LSSFKGKASDHCHSLFINEESKKLIQKGFFIDKEVKVKVNKNL
jgi:hypothetical protein